MIFFNFKYLVKIYFFKVLKNQNFLKNWNNFFIIFYWEKFNFQIAKVIKIRSQLKNTDTVGHGGRGVDGTQLW